MKTANQSKKHQEQSPFPIRVLAEKTGVGSSTLRAWERRYGLLKPQRTPKGHRLYSTNDVERVSKILDLIRDGHGLNAIADILSATDAQPTLTLTADNAQSAWQDVVDKTLDAIAVFNVERIDAIYNETSSLYPLDMVNERLVQPILTKLGEAWLKQPTSGIAEEHFYTSWLKNRLAARFHHAYSQARGTRIICSCLPGTYHEIGLMLFALSSLSRGYRVLYFGADLPLDQLPHIVSRSAARAVVLAAHATTPKVGKPLETLLNQVDWPIFVGGSAAPIDLQKFDSAGGIFLGDNLSIAMRLFENKIPVHSVHQSRFENSRHSQL